MSFAYTGCYTPNGGGIQAFAVDRETGGLTPGALTGGIADPTWLLIRGNILYATSELTPTGAVSAYRIDPADGALTLINRVGAEGGKPVHLSLHPGGRHLFVANYGSGTVAVLPVGEDGSLGRATDVQTDRGPVGPARPADAPPGSFVDSGHDGPHAHYIESDPTGRFVLHTDLGQDRIYVWRFDAGRLAPSATPFIAATPGSGPRHMAWHPDGRRVYALTEESSTLSAYRFEGGELTPLQTVSALPPGFAGTSYGSDLKLSADGRFAYAANRLHDSIATFAIERDLRLIGHCATEGGYPRTLVISGDFLYAMNQRSDAITVFRLTGGVPHFTGQYVPTGSPAHLAFFG
jgi:6-phosphogluconolactonase (cycloisomerase 2 family)